MKLLILIVSWKRFNYDKLVISITGDELHALPNAIEYTKSMIGMLEKITDGIPRSKIMLKMHTNCNAKSDYYDELMHILKDANKFSYMQYSIVYQSMYHSKQKEKMFNYIHKINTSELLSCCALVDKSHLAKFSKMKFDVIYDFYDRLELQHSHYVDDNRNYINIDKNGSIYNKCGHDVPKNLFSMEDRDYCKTCPNEKCIITTSDRLI
jgi:hypothetical protein